MRVKTVEVTEEFESNAMIHGYMRFDNFEKRASAVVLKKTPAAASK